MNEKIELELFSSAHAYSCTPSINRFRNDERNVTFVQLESEFLPRVSFYFFFFFSKLALNLLSNLPKHSALLRSLQIVHTISVATKHIVQCKLSLTKLT